MDGGPCVPVGASGLDAGTQGLTAESEDPRLMEAMESKLGGLVGF